MNIQKGQHIQVLGDLQVHIELWSPENALHNVKIPLYRNIPPKDFYKKI